MQFLPAGKPGGVIMNKKFIASLSALHLEGDAAQIVDRFMHHLKYELGKDQYSA